MIIGAMNNPKNDLVSEIGLFGEMGFDFAEITVEAPQAAPERLAASRKAVLDALHSYNFGVLAHMPWYFSVAHPYPRVQEAIISEFASAFGAASSLGAKTVTVHTEFLPSGLQERAVHVAKTIETLKRLEKEAAERGLALLVENAFASSFSIKEFKLLFSECDVGMTLDVGHAFTADGEGLGNYLQQFKKRIRHVHLHDNDRRGDLHLPLGAGKIDVVRCIKELKGFYDGTITLEIHSQDRDYLRISREKLEILWYGKRKFDENKEYLFPAKA
ncbi:MAG: sugar phosphate isomerase/epimerase [Candidatus Micrarchaeia archaeon]